MECRRVKKNMSEPGIFFAHNRKRPGRKAQGRSGKTGSCRIIGSFRHEYQNSSAGTHKQGRARELLTERDMAAVRYCRTQLLLLAKTSIIPMIPRRIRSVLRDAFRSRSPEDAPAQAYQYSIGKQDFGSAANAVEFPGSKLRMICCILSGRTEQPEDPVNTTLWSRSKTALLLLRYIYV